jgi:meiotic recombination protein SPO11
VQDAVFLQLSEDRFFEVVLPSILVTAKGMPDLSTRAFLHRLYSMFPHLPVLGEARCEQSHS